LHKSLSHANLANKKTFATITYFSRNLVVWNCEGNLASETINVCYQNIQNFSLQELLYQANLSNKQAKKMFAKTYILGLLMSA
jgi:hypothetical protein